MNLTVKADFAPIAKMLKELPDKFVVKDVKAEIKAGAQIFQEEAKKRCPVDTGLLRESIIVKAGYSKRDGVVFGKVGIRKIGRRELKRIREKKIAGKLPSFSQEFDAFYAGMVENGTEKMKPHPFMAPAFDEHAQEVLSDVTDGLKERLERDLSKLKEKELKGANS